MPEIKLTDRMVVVYRDGRSEAQKESARNNFEDMADMIAALSDRMWSAPVVSRHVFGGEAFTLDERKALTVMRAELHAMHYKLSTMRDAIERGEG